MNLRKQNVLLWMVGVGVLFPLFFQLDGGVYRDIFPITDSQGVLAKLPLPLSILTCLLAFAFITGNFAKIRPALAMIFGTILVSLLSVWFGGDGVTSLHRKLIMTMQVILPLGGLLLGQLVDDQGKIIARAFLVVLSVVVPLELLSTWAQGGLIVTHYLYVFSIYSHLQYVPVIFVCAFIFSLTSLWDEYKVWLCLLAIPMAVYLAASLSFLAIFAYVFLVLPFGVCKLWPHRGNAKLMSMSLALIAAVTVAGLAYYGQLDGKRASVEGQQALYGAKFKVLAEGKLPMNVLERLDDWSLFGRGILESKKSLLLGHAQPMPREIRSSPHNWYIDMAYTFGLVALLPILILMVYTACLCVKHRRVISSQTWWLAAIVFYLVVVDSNFKVTLRQPYPGIFAYFLWGLLLTRLRLPIASRPGA